MANHWNTVGFVLLVFGIGLNDILAQTNDTQVTDTQQPDSTATFAEVNLNVSQENVITKAVDLKPIIDKNDITTTRNPDTLGGETWTPQTDKRTYTLPEKWQDFCDIDFNEVMTSKFTPTTLLTTIRCNITQRHSGIWTMSDLRASLSGFENTSLAIAVDIRCDDSSTVSVSHPMKIHRLYKIFMQGCTVVDFLAEHSGDHLDTIPDCLREVRFYNNTVMISLNNLVTMMKDIKNVRKEFDCIHEETIESITNRDIHYDFLIDIDPTQVNLTELGEHFMYDSKRVEHKCNFVHLMYMDQGHTKSRSLYHMDLMTEYSFYDELLVYNYSYNYVKQLEDHQLKWSARFPKLEMFDLSHNEISKIYRFAVPLHTSSRVTTINLQYNKISTISVSNLQRFSEIPMMFIDLRNNPIDCNCSEPMKELVQYLKDGKHFGISNLADYSYLGELQCARPSSLEGRTLLSLSTDTVCEPEVEVFLVPILCLSAAIVLLSIILFVTLRYRQEITIILFTRFNIIVPCQSRENFDSNKRFDAFVSYSSSEEEYVEKLFEDLEKPSESRASFKFCLHHRDFIPGKTIFDNVAASVENSRHTIVLLSQHFLNSHYCLHEFQEAFRQSIMEQKRHLVIVMMEEIPEDRLPRDIRRCIKTFTYIRRDDYLFQERLIYALSVKQKSKTVTPNDKNKNKSFTRSGDVSSMQHTEIGNTNTETKSRSNGSLFNSILTKSSSKSNACSKCPNKNDKQRAVPLSNIIPVENQLDKPSLDEINANEHAFNTKTHRVANQKLEVNIKPEVSHINAPVERKISNDDYDRSMSTDTGYGSERGSYCEKLSPEVCLEMENFPPQPIDVLC